jgi:hypothetical protein
MLELSVYHQVVEQMKLLAKLDHVRHAQVAKYPIITKGNVWIFNAMVEKS